ncbi:MAG: ribonuclease HII [Clostridia bacterium]
MSDFTLENELISQGYKTICGIDEAGRGPFAGPVCASAVILPVGCQIKDLDDSKKIKSEKKRQILFEEVTKNAIDYGISMVHHDEIDEIGILPATFKAMRQAVKQLKTKPDYLLVDGNLYRNFDDYAGRFVIGGDGLSLSISGASILAKVTRDNYMNEQALIYPQYEFEKNKGYGGSKAHQNALLEYGPCKIHRMFYLRKFREKHNCNW